MARIYGTQVTSTDVAKNPGSSVSVLAASSTAIAAANAARVALILTNDGSNIVYLSFGGTAAVNSGSRLSPGDVLTLSEYTGAVAGRAVTADTLVLVTEI